MQNFLTNNLQCESSEDLVSAQDPYVNVLLEEVGLPSRGDDLSSLVQGEDRDIFISGAFSIAAYRRPVAGDSVFRDLACGLNACKRDDGRIASKYNLNSQRLVNPDMVVVGCHPACGNGDYYVCLRRK